MARSHAFWVILAGAIPTAFRSPKREDLLPTLHQLQRTQQNVTLMWFDRGRVWESPEAARAALLAKRHQFSDRKADWRPGGSHRDPRARYELSRDQKRARFKERLGRPPLEPRSDKPSTPRSDKPFTPRSDKPFTPRSDKPYGSRPDRPNDNRPPGDRWKKPKPFGKRPFRPHGDRPFRPHGDRPHGDRPPGARPPGDRQDRPRGDRPPGGSAKPFGRRPPGKFKPRGPRGPKRPR
jgi:23S rRNA pseudouridine2605 synthase